MDKELHRVVTTCIIYQKDKYLILQRSLEKKAFPGQWTVAGGGLTVEDYVNTPKTTKDVWYFGLDKTLRREIKEETNLAVGDFSYLLDMTFIRSDNIPVVILSFFAPYKSGTVKLDSDSINFAWISVKDLKKYDLIGGIREEILMADRILKGKKINNKGTFFKKLLKY